jgi:RHS repeat-associated protein
MLEKENGATVEDKRFLWYGYGIAEARDSGGTAVKRYFGGGVQQGGSNYLFTADHLGTVRELADTSGAARARYDVDPYGRRTKTTGDLDTDLGFTGTTAHGPSGLSLAVFRIYDPERARWLNEDPVGFAGGLNRYAYVDGDPINQVDPLGLWSQLHQVAAAVLPGLWLWHPTVLNSDPMMWAITPQTVNASAGLGDNLLSTFTLGFWNLGAAARQALGMGGLVDQCSGAYKAGEWAGFVASIALGGASGAKSLPAALRKLPRSFNAFKGNIGEVLSLANNLLRGSWPTAWKTAAIPHFRTEVDITFRSLWRGVYYVEAKFGTSGLTSAQRLAARYVAAYQVERWNYSFVGRVGGYLGAGLGSVLARPKGSDCGR